jgi:hypothetical protein
MRFKVGDLVFIVSSLSESVIYHPPALIIRTYEADPKIFLNNKEMNTEWLEEEDIGVGQVYDIFHRGIVEEAVLEEWLEPFVLEKISLH